MQILSKAQRNVLLNAVAESGLVNSEFSYERVPSFSGEGLDEALIKHGPTGSWFKIYRDSNNRFSFSAQVADDPWVPLDRQVKFHTLIGEARRWGNDVAEWVATPDLWKSMPGSAVVPGDLTPDSENTPFTSAEQSEISAQLRQIAEFVKKTYELTATQSAELDKKFEEADKASRRMGRKDWGLLFGGAILSLILSDTITPGIAGHILMMVEHGIGHLFMGGPSQVNGVLGAG